MAVLEKTLKFALIFACLGHVTRASIMHNFVKNAEGTYTYFSKPFSTAHFAVLQLKFKANMAFLSLLYYLTFCFRRFNVQKL